MWSSKTGRAISAAGTRASTHPSRRVVLIGLFGLSACGFTPVYAPSNADNVLFSRVEWQAPTTSGEFDLNEQLRHRLGGPAFPKWRLTYVYQTELTRLGGTDANRGRVYGTLSYELAPISGVGKVYSGKIETFAGFTIAETTPTDTAPIVSNRVARRDAERRLSTQMADRMVSELIARVGAEG